MKEKNESMNVLIQEYSARVAQGNLPMAYRFLMEWMGRFKRHLELRHPDFQSSQIYPGYMDMTYFAFTPEALQKEKLKVAVVFLHQSLRFEGWLGGANRQIQSHFIDLFRGIDLGNHRLSTPGPGIDSIIETELSSCPDFDHPEALMETMENRLMAFVDDLCRLVNAKKEGEKC